MATRAEKILAKSKQIKDDRERKEHEEREVERLRVGSERAEAERIVREKKAKLEYETRIYWERLGVLSIFEDLSRSIEGSDLHICKESLSLVVNNCYRYKYYISARYTPEFYEVEEEKITLFGHRTKMVKKRNEFPGLHIVGRRNMVVGIDGDLDELVAEALVDPETKSNFSGYSNDDYDPPACPGA